MLSKNEILQLLLLPLHVTSQIGIWPVIPSAPVAPPIEPSGLNDGNNDSDSIDLFCKYSKPNEGDRCEFKGACQYNARSCPDETDQNKIIFDTCKCRGGKYVCIISELKCKNQINEPGACPEKMPIPSSACDVKDQQCNYNPFGCPEREKINGGYYGDWMEKCICDDGNWQCLTNAITGCPRKPGSIIDGDSDDGFVGIYPIVPSAPVAPPTVAEESPINNNNDNIGIFPIITPKPVTTKPPKPNKSPVTPPPITSGNNDDGFVGIYPIIPSAPVAPHTVEPPINNSGNGNNDGIGIFPIITPAPVTTKPPKSNKSTSPPITSGNNDDGFVGIFPLITPAPVTKTETPNSTESPMTLPPVTSPPISSDNDGSIGIYPIISSAPVVPSTEPPINSIVNNGDDIGIFPIITTAPVVPKTKKPINPPATIPPVTDAPVTIPPVTTPPVSSNDNGGFIGIFPIITPAPVVTKPPKPLSGKKGEEEI